MPRPWIFRCWSLLAVSLLTFVSFSPAVLVNVTVDDSLPDPVTGSRIVYSPPENWIAGAAGCTNCTALPNTSRALDGTWHESSFFPVWEGGGPADVVPTATFSFEGSALYVFCIIAHTTLSPETNTDMVFVLDGQTMGSLTVVTSGSSYFEYNILVFANNSMPYGQHTFTLQTGRIGGARSLVLLDFIMYTHDDGTLPAISTQAVQTLPFTDPPAAAIASPTFTSIPFSESPQTGVPDADGTLTPGARAGIIAASTLGGVGLVLAAALVGMCWRRRRYRAYNLPPDTYSIPATDVTEDPSASGWVEGTWPKPEEPIHPSLVSNHLLKGGAKSGSGEKRGRTRMRSLGSATNSILSGSAWSKPASVDLSGRTHSRTNSRGMRSPLFGGALTSPGGNNGVYSYSVTSPTSPSFFGRSPIKSPGVASLPPYRGNALVSGSASSSTSALPLPRLGGLTFTSNASEPNFHRTDYNNPKLVTSVNIVAPGLPPQSQLSRSISADAVTVRFTPNRHPDTLTRGGGSDSSTVPVRVPRPAGIYVHRKPVPVNLATDETHDRTPAS